MDETAIVDWLGPASPGQQVYWLQINAAYCAHPHGSVISPGWTFIEHLDGLKARIKIEHLTAGEPS